jgi:hypothetical protein
MCKEIIEVERCPKCGVVKNEMHFMIGNYAVENRKQRLEILDLKDQVEFLIAQLVKKGVAYTQSDQSQE